MSKSSNAVAAAAAILALAAATGASAKTYSLTQDFCSGGCGTAPFGTVTTTSGGAGVVDVSVALDPDWSFHDGGSGKQHYAVAFDLASSVSSVTIGGLPAPFTVNGVQAAGSNDDDGAGHFDYVITFPKSPGASTKIQDLDFTVSAPGLTVDDFIANAKNLVFAVDVNECSLACTSSDSRVLATGNVGGEPGGTVGVPEPATWSMMLVGVFGLGGMLRRRRAPALAGA